MHLLPVDVFTGDVALCKRGQRSIDAGCRIGRVMPENRLGYESPPAAAGALPESRRRRRACVPGACGRARRSGKSQTGTARDGRQDSRRNGPQARPTRPASSPTAAAGTAAPVDGSAAARRRRLLEDHVRVGAAEAERADARATAVRPRRPRASPAWRLRPACRPRRCAGSAARKCRCGGISPCRSASTTLISPATPAAASRWPMFVFTEPTQQRRVVRSPRAATRPPARGPRSDRRAACRCRGPRRSRPRSGAMPAVAQRLRGSPPPAPARSARSARCCGRPG